jgi:putative oxygen-independent coproporphyrinogen III oxidase
MGSAPPDGDPAPADGALPASALASAGERGLGLYVHVPFCAKRCGYCDFNTYTAAELGPPGGPPGASRETYADAAVAEIGFARRVLARTERPVETVFFGGGTPTLLPPSDLVRILGEVDDRFGLAPDAEVTTEANPDSVSPADLAVLREGGFNRISFGMQSSVRHVLRVLDRTHDPDGVPRAVQWARDAGFEQVSLDLIYGTPGESLDDWRRSLESALACRPDHVSAYALIVEDGTALARRVVRGEVAAPDDDDLADKYLLGDEALTAAGLSWYELSNWARDEAAQCRHNLLYWRGGDWWGIGPGAHSHVAGVRFWNVRNPRAYAERIGQGVSPAEAREVLDEPTARMERILLETRLVDGLPVSVLDERGRGRLPGLRDSGLVGIEGERVVLTREGRLLADAVVRDLVP